MNALIKFQSLFLGIFLISNALLAQVELIEVSGFSDWWTYHNTTIKFYKDFEGQDLTGSNIGRKQFFEYLKTGEYIPVEIPSGESSKPVYRLQKLNSEVTDYRAISSTIQQTAEIEIFNLNWENKEFPDFLFKDLSGNVYDPNALIDKVVLLKTYFIKCQACNAEMKELNGFAKRIKSDKILFLSLADDPAEDLAGYLKGRGYQYEFVPDQKRFIGEKLGTNIYPTHFVIKNGKVVKVLNKGVDLIDFIGNNQDLLR